MVRLFHVVAIALIVASSASAMIQVGKGNKPVTDMNWPLGALEIANLKTRLGWTEGPPFGGGQWTFFYQGDTAAFQEALDLLSKIRAPEVALVIHGGAEPNSMLKDEQAAEGPKVDWSFTVWSPQNWHQINSNPMNLGFADFPTFRQPLPPPTIDVNIGGGKIDWSAVKVPANVKVTDERADANGFTGSLIRGDVFDMITSKPVSGAQIALMEYKQPQGWAQAKSVQTDADGRFELKDLSPGSFQVHIKSEKRAARALSHIQLRPNTVKRYTVYLSPAVTINGTVVDSDSKPLAGVKVQARSTVGIDGLGYRAPDDSGAATTDEQGKFSLSGVPQGYTWLQASLKELYQLDPFANVQVPPKGDVTIRMTRTGKIKGTVVDKLGNPVTSGMVSVDPPGDPVGKWGGSGNIKPDGTFQFDGVPPGPYTIYAAPNPRSTNVPLNSKQIEVKASETIELQLEQSAASVAPRRRGG